MFPNRRIIKTVATLALVVLVTGCGSPSIPEMQLSGTSTPTHEIVEGEQGILSPEESLRVDAESYAERFGVTLEEAIQRLQFQEGIGALNAALQADQADTFGGLWIEHEPDFRIVTLFTRDGEQTIRPYLAGKPFAQQVEVRQARYTLAELETIYAQAIHELAKLDFDVNASLDVSGNRVEVTVSDREGFEAELDRVEGQLPEGVEVTVVEGASTARDMDLLLTPLVPGIAFPRQKPVEGFGMCMTALLIGTLRLEEGCLYVQPLGGGGNLVPIWQPGHTLRIEGDQMLVINESGEVAAQVGEEVYMGGGGGSIDAWVQQQIPSACQGDYWIACGVRPNLRSETELFALDVIQQATRKVLFLRYKPELDQQVEDSGSISGVLVAEDYNRCLHLQTDNGSSMNLLWPADWSARLEDQTVVVLDAAGEVVARMGDEVRLRGRAIPHSGDDPVYRQLINELPGDCMGAAWMVDGTE